MPTYNMHIFRFPVAVCKKLDQLCRNFLWGHVNSHGRIHLINWNIVTRRKYEGGLGLHKFREFNTALLGKIAWGLINRPNDLWAQVLINKYKGRWKEDWKLSVKQGDPWLWNAITGAWNEISQWMGWGIGNGCHIKFWQDRWIFGKSLCKDLGVGSIPEVELNRPLRDFILESGNWNWSAFEGKINLSVLLSIASIKPPEGSSNVSDFPVWLGSKNGDYSVSVTYFHLTSIHSVELDMRIWKAIS